MSTSKEPKQALFEQLAVMARALGSAARLELIDFLAQGQRSVEELVCRPSLLSALEFDGFGKIEVFLMHALCAPPQDPEPPLSGTG